MFDISHEQICQVHYVCKVDLMFGNVARACMRGAPGWSDEIVFWIQANKPDSLLTFRCASTQFHYKSQTSSLNKPPSKGFGKFALNDDCFKIQLFSI